MCETIQTDKKARDAIAEVYYTTPAMIAHPCLWVPGNGEIRTVNKVNMIRGILHGIDDFCRSLLNHTHQSRNI